MAKRSKARLEVSLGMSVDEEVLITEIGTRGRAHGPRARKREPEKSTDICTMCVVTVTLQLLSACGLVKG